MLMNLLMLAYLIMKRYFLCSKSALPDIYRDKMK